MEELEGLLEVGSVAAVELAASALAERGSAPKPCPNCHAPMIGPYCAVCGQPHNTHRRTLKHLVQEFVKDIASFDSRILRTARALLFEPGELPKSFREGRTQPFVPAIRLYLFVSLLFFLFLSTSGLALVQLGLQAESVKYTHDSAGHVYRDVNGVRTLVKQLKSDKDGNLSIVGPADTSISLPKDKADGKSATNTITTRAVFFQRPGNKDVQITPELRKRLDEVNKEMAQDTESAGWLMRGFSSTITKLETDPAALNGPLTTWIPRILFVLLPLFAVVLLLFYRGKRKNYLFVDHLVFSLTMHTFAFVALIGAAILAQILSGGMVAALTWLVLSVYLFLSMKHFYGDGWVKTGLKFVGVTFIYTVFFLAPALAFALAASIVAGG